MEPNKHLCPSKGSSIPCSAAVFRETITVAVPTCLHAGRGVSSWGRFAQPWLEQNQQTVCCAAAQRQRGRMVPMDRSSLACVAFVLIVLQTPNDGDGSSRNKGASLSAPESVLLC